MTLREEAEKAARDWDMLEFEDNENTTAFEMKLNALADTIERVSKAFAARALRIVTDRTGDCLPDEYQKEAILAAEHDE